MEGGGGEDEDGGVDEEGEHEGEAGVPGAVLDSHFLAFFRAWVGAGLDDAGVQEQAVGHDGGTQNANGVEEKIRVGDDFGSGVEPSGDFHPAGFHGNELVHEHPGDDQAQQEHYHFQASEAARSEHEDEHGVYGCDQHAGPQWEPE